MAAFDVLVETVELTAAKRGLHVWHSVVEPECDLLVIPRTLAFIAHKRRISRHTMASIEGHALGQLQIVCDRRPPFRRRDDLHWVKAKHHNVAVTAISDWVIDIASAKGVGRIFDDFEPIPLR